MLTTFVDNSESVISVKLFFERIFLSVTQIKYPDCFPNTPLPIGVGPCFTPHSPHSAILNTPSNQIREVRSYGDTAILPVCSLEPSRVEMQAPVSVSQVCTFASSDVGIMDCLPHSYMWAPHRLLRVSDSSVSSSDHLPFLVYGIQPSITTFPSPVASQRLQQNHS